MQNTNPNSYVQYITKSGHIKVKDLEREVESNNIIYNLTGIEDDFFLLGLYDLNNRVYGLTFGNVQNLDMIAFLNSEFQTVELLPEMSYFPAHTYVAIVKDTNVYDINFELVENIAPIDVTITNFPKVQLVQNVIQDGKNTIFRETVYGDLVLPGTTNEQLLKTVKLSSTLVSGSFILYLDYMGFISTSFTASTVKVYISDDINNLKKGLALNYTLPPGNPRPISTNFPFGVSPSSVQLPASSLIRAVSSDIYVSIYGTSPLNASGSYRLDTLIFSRFG